MAGLNRLGYRSPVARLRFFFRMAFSAMKRAAGATVLSIATISISLAILGAFGLAWFELDSRVATTARSLTLSAYLDRDVDEERAEVAAIDIAAWPEVGHALFLSSEAAMEAFRAQLGPDAVLVEGLPSDVIPPSYEVQLAEGRRSSRDARFLAERLAAREEVEEVRWGADRFQRLEFVRRSASVAFGVLGAALVLATLSIIANTIRLTVLARREELDVLSLVGATGTFIRAPFLIEGLLQGFAGGLLAGLWLLGLDEAMSSALAQLMETEVRLRVGPWLPAAAGAGGVLGLLGASLAVGRFVRR